MIDFTKEFGDDSSTENGSNVEEVVGNHFTKYNIFKDEPPVPTEYDFSVMKRDRDAFSAVSFGKPTYQMLDNVEKMFKLLNEKGYTLRATGNASDYLNRSAEEVISEIEHYLPYATYNKTIKDPTVGYPSKEAFNTSAEHAYNYEGLKEGLKGFLAQSVHIMSGKLLDRPLSFLIVYTECGTETTVGKGIDYSKLKIGHISNYFKHAGILNIPIFNIKNEDALDRLQKYLGDKDGK